VAALRSRVAARRVAEIHRAGERVLDPTALHFINALRLAMPKAPEPSVYWGYMFLLGTMVQVISATGRIERVSRGLCHSDDVDAALREIVPLSVAVCAPWDRRLDRRRVLPGDECSRRRLVQKRVAPE
jgi:hypothetical protein